MADATFWKSELPRALQKKIEQLRTHSEQERVDRYAMLMQRLAFKRVALAMGLEGKMTATTEGAKFKEMIAPILKRAGPLPHKRLSAFRTKKKQSTRLLKCECLECGYIARVTGKWIDSVGAPFCGTKGHGRMYCDDVNDEDGEE